MALQWWKVKKHYEVRTARPDSAHVSTGLTGRYGDHSLGSSLAVCPNMASYWMYRAQRLDVLNAANTPKGGGFPLLYDFFLIYRNSSSLEQDV